MRQAIIALDRGVTRILDRTVDPVLKWAIVILIGLMTVVISIGVFFRESFTWPEEMARFAQIYVAMLGGAYAVRISAHLGIDALTRVFPPFWRHSTAIVVSLLIGAFAAIVMIGGGAQYAGNFWNQSASAMTFLSMGKHIYIALPVAGVLVIIYCIELILHSLAALLGAPGASDVHPGGKQ